MLGNVALGIRRRRLQFPASINSPDAEVRPFDPHRVRHGCNRHGTCSMFLGFANERKKYPCSAVKPVAICIGVILPAACASVILVLKLLFADARRFWNLSCRMIRIRDEFDPPPVVH
jgi:hypothetical protein